MKTDPCLSVNFMWFAFCCKPVCGLHFVVNHFVYDYFWYNAYIVDLMFLT